MGRPRNREEPYSRIGNPKRMRSVVFYISKGYESIEWALLSERIKLAQKVELLSHKQMVVGSIPTFNKMERPTQR